MSVALVGEVDVATWAASVVEVVEVGAARRVPAAVWEIWEVSDLQASGVNRFPFPTQGATFPRR